MMVGPGRGHGTTVTGARGLGTNAGRKDQTGTRDDWTVRASCVTAVFGAVIPPHLLMVSTFEYERVMLARQLARGLSNS